MCEAVRAEVGQLRPSDYETPESLQLGINLPPFTKDLRVEMQYKNCLGSTVG